MRKRFADGKVTLPYKQFLGYRKGTDGLPEIVPEEAEIVKSIYYMFLQGKAPSFIARYLTDTGVPTPGGKSNWRPNTVENILANEKCMGEAILQKSFTVDFLTKKKKANEGEVPQYYVEGSHPAIIEPEVFDAVQVELKSRKAPGRRNYTPHCFSRRIYCGECGALYGSKVWNSGSRYKSLVWQCNAKHRGYTACETPSLRTEAIQEVFIEIVNQIIDNKADIIRVCEATLGKSCNPHDIDLECASLQAELEVVTGLMQRHVSANAHAVLDQADYKGQYDEYAARHAKIRDMLAELRAQREALVARSGQMRLYIDALKKQPVITEFDERL